MTQPTIVQPSIATVPPVVPPPGASTAGQAVLSLTARYGKDLPVINNGLVWRVFADRPDETGTFKLIREDRGATPEHRAAAGQLRRPCRARPRQRGARGDA